MISNEKRVADIDRLLGEVISIAEHPSVCSFVPAITKLMDFLKKVGVAIVNPTMPEGSSCDDDLVNMSNICRFLTDEDQSDLCIGIYLAYQEDASTGVDGRYYAEWAKGSHFAGYGCLYNNIVVNIEMEETMRFFACALLHELGHAEAAHIEGRVLKEGPHTPAQRLFEEAAVWSLEARLMLALGGPEYACQVMNLVDKICYDWKKERQTKYPGLGIALDCVLGSPPTDWTRKVRDNAFLAFCQLIAAEKFFPEHQWMGVKMEIMRHMSEGRYAQETDPLVERYKYELGIAR